MAVRINPARLRSERLGRRWSQDQLSAISGVSVRTIQRLERGRAATPTSLAALALALSLPEAALVASDGLVRRVTPLAIAGDLAAARRLYAGLGFTAIETENPDCVGMRAGATAMILCTPGFLRGDFARTDFEPLVGRTLPYLWVQSVEAASAVYSRVVEDVHTRGGTREALVDQDGQWAILAETLP